MKAGNGAAVRQLGSQLGSDDGQTGGLLEMLGGALDRNGDGSARDDITGIIGKTFGRG